MAAVSSQAIAEVIDAARTGSTDPERVSTGAVGHVQCGEVRSVVATPNGAAIKRLRWRPVVFHLARTGQPRAGGYLTKRCRTNLSPGRLRNRGPAINADRGHRHTRPTQRVTVSARFANGLRSAPKLQSSTRSAVGTRLRGEFAPADPPAAVDLSPNVGESHS